jgi:hypothetical protein
MSTCFLFSNKQQPEAANITVTRVTRATTAVIIVFRFSFLASRFSIILRIDDSCFTPHEQFCCIQKAQSRMPVPSCTWSKQQW